MECPDCGGPMWDNRDNKRNPKQPDFKCKDKDGCGKGVWVKKSSGSSAPLRNPPPRNNRPLGPLYNECMAFAQKACAFYFKGKETPADVIAATTTIFIQAVRDGANIAQPKAKPAPPPPPPEEEFEEFPGALDDDDAASLPF